ncbi:ABC transporter ATP-binding protein [Legionella israelensis]|uniref:ABC transporter ATP-binding protein n=1 Tax=Legionella israelensis TaxID=454 RepID=UPI00117D0B50|nr:ABC transporter ATP-binding protein [Legionella israelensis]QDP72246.1 ABC transporter ATP-binding protein [Legionella israelensis]
MTDDNIIIDVKNLAKSFDDQVVVNHINLHVVRGEVFGFLGPNGSGKTTTIRMLCGLLTPDAGTGTCLGYDLIDESDKIKRHVGYMTQKFSFYTDLSIEENLDFIARIYGVEHRKEKIEEIMEEFSLTPRRKQLTGHLSGGWKQRVALAACLIHKPELLLLDEPTAGVDPVARREFWDKIHLLSEQGVTIFVSTHYMDEAERCTRLAYLSRGNLLVTGKVDDIIAKTQLNTWEITGFITTALLKQIKEIEGVTQAALFGNQIHICGEDVKKIEKELKVFSEKNDLSWKRIKPTLEDAYINLLKKSNGEQD